MKTGFFFATNKVLKIFILINFIDFLLLYGIIILRNFHHEVTMLNYNPCFSKSILSKNQIAALELLLLMLRRRVDDNTLALIAKANFLSVRTLEVIRSVLNRKDFDRHNLIVRTIQMTDPYKAKQITFGLILPNSPEVEFTLYTNEDISVQQNSQTTAFLLAGVRYGADSSSVNHKTIVALTSNMQDIAQINTIFSKIANDSTSGNGVFEIGFTRKNLNVLISLTGMEAKQFSKEFGVTYANLKNWQAGRSSMRGSQWDELYKNVSLYLINKQSKTDKETNIERIDDGR